MTEGAQINLRLRESGGSEHTKAVSDSVQQQSPPPSQQTQTSSPLEIAKPDPQALDRLVPGLPVLSLKETLARQRECIETAETTRDLLEQSQYVSAFAYEALHQRYLHHIQALQRTRGELQQIFTQIRRIKSKLNQRHPEIAKHVHQLHKHGPQRRRDGSDDDGSDGD